MRTGNSSGKGRAIIAKLVALCAVAALALACIAADPAGSPGDDGDDEIAFTFDLSTVLPASRAEPPLTVVAPSGAVVMGEQAPHGRQPELDIFRPPRTTA